MVMPLIFLSKLPMRVLGATDALLARRASPRSRPTGCWAKPSRRNVTPINQASMDNKMDSKFDAKPAIAEGMPQQVSTPHADARASSRHSR
jgi:hypothetical protein